MPVGVVQAGQNLDHVQRLLSAQHSRVAHARLERALASFSRGWHSGTLCMYCERQDVSAHGSGVGQLVGGVRSPRCCISFVVWVA